MWYDVFSLFYDRSLEALYRKPRAAAVAALGAPPKSTILDVACGTGQNFAPLQEHIGDGTIIGVDPSRGMLKQARRRTRRAGWTNVHLAEADIHTFDARQLEALCGHAAADGILCALGFTVIPDWEAAFRHCFALLRSGGRFAIFDVHAERRTLQTWSVELLSGADTARRVWQPLEAMTPDFELTDLPGSPYLFGGRLFVATGTKP
jgi:ubiquinone/menaquinone biosynthesis C-methylase UbiE